MAGAEYELVLMLDPEAPDERRDEIAEGARKRIESAGALKHADDWGMRKMAYEIRQRTEADYRFYRFEGESPLLDDLDHALKITDGVLRFRIFKVDPRVPVIAPPVGPVVGARSRGEGRRGAPRERAAAATAEADRPAAEQRGEGAEEPAAAPEGSGEAAETGEPAEQAGEEEEASGSSGEEPEAGEAES